MFIPSTLVLAKNYAPLSIIPKLSVINGQEALSKFLSDKCDVIEFYDRPVLSRNDPIEVKGKGILFWPSVIVDFDQRIKSSIALSCSTLYFREDGKCFYCHEVTEMNKGNIDHVIPKSKGGKSSFDNLVFSCYKCNREKDDSMPVGKWKMNHKPYKPSYHEIFEKRKKYEVIINDESWSKYLPGFANYKLRKV